MLDNITKTTYDKNIILCRIRYAFIPELDKYYFVCITSLGKKHKYGLSCKKENFESVCDSIKKLANGDENAALLLHNQERNTIYYELSKKILLERKVLKLVKFQEDEKFMVNLLHEYGILL
jgi:UDP-N-acetylglucosamine 2-epimerase